MYQRLMMMAVLAAGIAFSPAVRSATLRSPPSSATASPVPVQVIEYYHPRLDHYFITADPAEIAALDSGAVTGWARTGYQFGAFTPESAGDGLSSVCRFYGSPSAGLDSHFYSGSPAECAAVLTKFAGAWILESADVFRIAMPDVSTGACPSSAIPVYRLYNNRSDANHRYTTSPAVRSGMIARGYVSEGYGPDGIGFCAANEQTPSAATAAQLSIIITQVSEDMFTFGSTLSAAMAVTVASYTWSFGDGTVDSSPSPSHQYAASGDYTVVLTATDTQGRQYAATKSVTAKSSTATPSSAGSDFDQRKKAAGVIRWFDFDSVDQLGSTAYGANFGYGPGERAAPAIDTNTKASGAGSLRFDVYGLTGSNAAGSWYANFSPDLSVRFGENSEFYIQWRQRFNQAFIDTFFTEDRGDGKSHPQEGIKQIVVSPGNTPTKIYNSCEANDVVVQTYYQKRVPWAYNSCTGSASHGPYSAFEQRVPMDQGFSLLQNMQQCTYNDNQTAGTTPSAGCVGWVANEWMTFQLGVKFGPRNDVTHEYDQSQVMLWIGREGQPSKLVLWWRPGINSYFPLTAGTADDPNQMLGKVFLLPYMTGKNRAQDHALAQTWYDELIISRQRIPDPGASTASSSTTTPSSATKGALPVWRKNMPIGIFSDIPNTANLKGIVDYATGRPGLYPQSASFIVDAWNGIATRKESNDLWFVASSGHGQWWNGIVGVNLGNDQIQPTLVDRGSDPSIIDTTDATLRDGRPIGRHTYTESQYLSNGNKLLLLGTNAAYGINAGWGGGPNIESFDLGTKAWDTSGSFGQVPTQGLSKYGYLFTSAVRDYRDGTIYLAGGYSLWKTTDGKNWTLMIRDRTDDRFLSWDQGPSAGNTYPCIDTKRNRIVVLHSGYPYSVARGVRLQAVGLADGKLTEIPVSGLPAPTLDSTSGVTYVHLAEAALAYDEDNDRYLYPHGTTVYAIDPASGTAKAIATIPGPNSSTGFQTVENRFDYFPKLGGVLYIPRFGSNWMFMATR